MISVSLHEVLSIDEKLRATLEKKFQLNFDKKGNCKVRITSWPADKICYFLMRELGDFCFRIRLTCFCLIHQYLRDDMISI